MREALTIDTHVHTRFSIDSEASMEEYCETALANGLQGICFTDHVDFSPLDWGYDYYDADGFFKAFYRAKEAYGHKLELLCGVEFGSPHIFQREFDQCAQRSYDIILCSVHDWYEGLFASEMAVHPMPVEDSSRLYWEEVYKMASFGGFDALAHFDFPKRYYKAGAADDCVGRLDAFGPDAEGTSNYGTDAERRIVYFWDMLDDIFCEMVKNDISLEINTSTLRKGLNEPMPGKTLLDMYKKRGGRYLTYGSDAHAPRDLGAGADVAAKLSEGFEVVKYVGRKRIAV